MFSPDRPGEDPIYAYSTSIPARPFVPSALPGDSVMSTSRASMSSTHTATTASSAVWPGLRRSHRARILLLRGATGRWSKEKLRMSLLGVGEVVSTTVVADRSYGVSAATKRTYPWLHGVVPNGVETGDPPVERARARTRRSCSSGPTSTASGASCSRNSSRRSCARPFLSPVSRWCAPMLRPSRGSRFSAACPTPSSLGSTGAHGYSASRAPMRGSGAVHRGAGGRLPVVAPEPRRPRGPERWRVWSDRQTLAAWHCVARPSARRGSPTLHEPGRPRSGCRLLVDRVLERYETIYEEVLRAHGRRRL